VDREHRKKALGVAIRHRLLGLVGRRSLDQFVQGLVSKRSCERLAVLLHGLLKGERLIVAEGPGLPEVEVAAPSRAGCG
jgi:hypothetical protein